jgi:hypothetical protein
VSEINVISRTQHIVVDPPSRNVDVVNVLTTPGGSSVIPPVEAWISLPLMNGWAIFGSEFEPPAYMKDPFGFVHVKGLVTHGSDRTLPIATLPIGYRPALTVGFASPNAGGFGDLRVGGVASSQGDGVLRLSGVTVIASHCFLDMICFRAR